ncbi:MAG: CHRD domain-containing protein [Opitutaceae bacterium]
MKARHITAVLALALSALAAHAQLYHFDINLDASQEPSAPASSGLGSGSATLDWPSLMFTLDFAFVNLVAPTTASHVHQAPPGVNGPVLIPLTLTPLGSTFGSGHFDSVITEAQALAILSGDTYVNVHTTAYPGGEIRGQIVAAAGPVPEPSTYALLGAGALLGGIVLRRFRAQRATV